MVTKADYCIESQSQSPFTLPNYQSGCSTPWKYRKTISPLLHSFNVQQLKQMHGNLEMAFPMIARTSQRLVPNIFIAMRRTHQSSVQRKEFSVGQCSEVCRRQAKEKIRSQAPFKENIGGLSGCREFVVFLFKIHGDHLDIALMRECLYYEQNTCLYATT